eukprot:2292425-Lingulodinium_polyedra.AAC.1
MMQYTLSDGGRPASMWSSVASAHPARRKRDLAGRFRNARVAIAVHRALKAERDSVSRSLIGAI